MAIGASEIEAGEYEAKCLCAWLDAMLAMATIFSSLHIKDCDKVQSGEIRLFIALIQSLKVEYKFSTFSRPFGNKDTSTQT